VFRKVKDTPKPVVVHINTKKGKGYRIAEENKEGWHWIAPFNIETGEKKRKASCEFYGNIVGDYLFKKMQQDASIVYITPAVPMTIGFTPEKRRLAGHQFVDVGISEEQAVTMAAGVAKNGGKPVVATHSTFYQRTYDQISHDLCINNIPATLLVRNGSVWGANDISHLGFFDIAMMSNIPNLVYLAPTNCEEYLAMLDWSIEQQEHPVAIRIPCNPVVHTDKSVETDYSDLNKNLVTINGEKLAIFALGDFYQMGEEFATAIKEKMGFQPTLVNPRYITGLDTELLESLKANHQLVVTLEDGIIEGGYGQKIASYYGDSDMKVRNFGFKKEFVDRYDANELLEQSDLSKVRFVGAVAEILKQNIV
jgi:1-deoxy-D-xylulose-5-phosphate synthase